MVIYVVVDRLWTVGSVGRSIDITPSFAVASLFTGSLGARRRGALNVMPDDRPMSEQKLDRHIDDPEGQVTAVELAAAKNRTLGEAIREGLRQRGLSDGAAQQGGTDV